MKSILIHMLIYRHILLILLDRRLVYLWNITPCHRSETQFMGSITSLSVPLRTVSTFYQLF